jgi:type I restriction enzyme, S subunit
MADSEWTPSRLGDLVEIKHGWPFKSEHFHEELTGQPIVVSVGNFRYAGGFRFGETSVKEYRGSYPKEYELAPGDILLIMTCQTAGGEILGIPARIPNDGRTYLHNQRLGKVVIRGGASVASDFLYWMFLWQEFNRELVTSASGTKILHTAPSRIEVFRFDLPPENEQLAIARILGTLDNKIELNRRMNETLEAMARALFKSWFVDFEPARAKAEGRDPGLPIEIADLFPDSFEGSELGEIPSGWSVASILGQAKLLSGGTPSTQRPEYWNGPIPWASAKDVSQSTERFLVATERNITQRGLEESSTQIIPARCSVVVARGATTGRMVLFGKPMAMNQTCYALMSTIDTPFALHCLLDQEMERLVRAAHGSVFDTITTSTFASSRVIHPPAALFKAFESQVTPLFLRILNSTEERATLSDLRNTLLPKLISGELRVGDVERLAAAGSAR